MAKSRSVKENHLQLTPMCKQFSKHYNKRIKVISGYFELHLRHSTTTLLEPITNVRRKAEARAKVMKVITDAMLEDMQDRG